MNIIQRRKYTYIFSAVLIAVSIAAVSVWGLKIGIDFSGGTLMEVRFSGAPPSADAVKEKISAAGVFGALVQPTEGGVILRFPSQDDATNETVIAAVQEIDGGARAVRTDFIGPSASRRILERSLLAVAIAIVGVALYVAWAFRKVSYPVSSWYYGGGAIIALAHDIVITVGAFAVFGKFFGAEVGVPFVAAVLTILGYSVNDTIVVFDRTRENISRRGLKEGFEGVVNRSVGETLARSINTSLTVVIVLVAMILWGGEAVRWFSSALLVGVVAGTYSSIFIASALLVTIYNWKQKIGKR